VEITTRPRHCPAGQIRRDDCSGRAIGEICATALQSLHMNAVGTNVTRPSINKLFPNSLVVQNGSISASFLKRMPIA
jgi:hypothetical protein